MSGPSIDQTPRGRQVKLIKWGGVNETINVLPGTMGTAISWTTFDIGHGRTQRTLQVQWARGDDWPLVEGQDEWEWVDNY